MAVALAAGLRFYRLGEWPPGPYRDEAYNGLDALDVLRGRHALFFPANNGREPIYIYLVALSLALFGPTTLALRLPAALIGTLAVAPTYLLGRAWFGRATGLLAALLWAITFWPVHLGRIGLRAGLLAPALALAFWLGTLAYRRRRAGLWFVAGLVYGLSFYTYLAARFTPLILLLFALYLLLTGRRERLWDGGRVLWFALGGALAVAPLAAVLVADPALIFGRAGQVSILSPEISGGDPLGALLGNVGRALGMYLWRGDDILRHNALLAYAPGTSGRPLLGDFPAGRPVFDLFMAVPFLVGLLWCLWRRRPAAVLLILWQLVMLGPSILAEDAPHFLRAAGVLPGAVFFPAIGLALLWHWPRQKPGGQQGDGRHWLLARRALVCLLLLGSAALTARDYMVYAQQPNVAYLWEAAAADLARAAAADAAAGQSVAIDRRFVEGWPSIPFLLGDWPVTIFAPEAVPPTAPGPPAVLYAWPYGALDFLAAVGQPATVAVTPGPSARGDLEPEAYSLYTRYAVTPGLPAGDPTADFDGQFRLHAAATLPAAGEAAVELTWEPAEPPAALPNVFIHVIGPEGMLAQYDGPLGRGLWPLAAWRPGLAVVESHHLTLPRPFDPASDALQIGLYWPDTGQRLPMAGANGAAVDDKVTIPPQP